MIKLKNLLNEGLMSQTKITNLNDTVKKLISKLEKKYPTASISLADNYKWLGRADLKGTYTLGVSTDDDSIISKIKKDIDVIRKTSER